MNRIIFGDNQFFGVNHLSEEKSRIQSKKFQNVQNIIKVLDFVNEIGIKDFMVTTYADLQEICNHFSLNPDKYKGFRINPCLPYAHKYANEVSELGILGTLNKYLKGNVFKNIKKGGVALLKKDFINIMEILIDVEVKMFNNVEKECIFLQNVVTDLLLGLGMDNFFVEFDKYIKNTYNVKAGFITMNMPLLYDRLEAKGIKNPIICTSFNKIKPTKIVEAIKRIIETVLTNSQSIFIPSIPIFSSAKNGSILHFDKIKIAVRAPPIGSIYFDDSSSKKSKKEW